jgi:hypothetical protein
MAAFTHFLFAHGAFSESAAVASTPAISQRQWMAPVRSAIGEVALFLWTVLMLGFSFLVIAAFLLPQV